MQTSPVLLVSTSGHVGTLLGLAVVAVVVWFLIWLLLRPGRSGALATASIHREDSAAGIDPAPAAPGDSDVESESARRVALPPSRAFSIWPAPADTVAAADDHAETDEGSNIPETETDTGPPPNFPPSRAFSIWPLPAGAADAKETDAAGAEEIRDEEHDEGGDQDESETDDPVTIGTTAEEAAARFRADLESGVARQDAALGIVYDAAPEDEDDLKEIKGVAKVLEGKLQDFGIYKYKQIAFWTDAAIAEFDERLNFKNRIRRDDWIGQARELHREKYGEKL